jgi:hypothetical protein
VTSPWRPDAKAAAVFSAYQPNSTIAVAVSASRSSGLSLAGVAWL